MGGKAKRYKQSFPTVTGTGQRGNQAENPEEPRPSGQPGPKRFQQRICTMRTKPKKPERRDGRVLMFVASITTRSGKRIHAKDYGLKAFPIWVRDKAA